MQAPISYCTELTDPRVDRSKYHLMLFLSDFNDLLSAQSGMCLSGKKGLYAFG
jgi:hypothetical protein